MDMDMGTQNVVLCDIQCISLISHRELPRDLKKFYLATYLSASIPGAKYWKQQSGPIKHFDREKRCWSKNRAGGM